MSTGAVRAARTALGAALEACRRHLTAAAAFSALVNLLYLAPTLYMLLVYDRVVPNEGVPTLVVLTAVLLIALATLSLLDMVRARLLVRASMRLDRQLARAVLALTLGRHGGMKSITRQVVRELDTFRQTLTGPGIIALFDAPWTPVYMLVCLWIHWSLGLLALGGGVTLAFIAWRSQKVTTGPMQEANQAANLAYVSHEYSAANAGVIRALGMRDMVLNRHLVERGRMIGLQTQASFRGGGYITLTRFVRLALQSLGLGLGAYLAVNRQISAGSIFAASWLIGRAMTPIDQVLASWKSLLQGRAAYRTLSELFSQANDGSDFTRLPAPTGQLTVENLTVLNRRAADAAPILADVSFGLRAGETVGILGPSGAGKSTLVRMIAGAEMPDRGAVRFDGADRREWNPETLGAQIGYMPQDPTLFAGTIKANICRFRTFSGEDPETVDAQVVAAAQMAGAHEMILRLPAGYQTELGLDGKGLSAGQLQRVALARALFGAPKLLILDEPNAPLDVEGEALLLETLKTFKAGGGAAIVVAHRTGILAALDKVLMLREGRLEVYGPRDAVIRRLAAAARARGQGRGAPPASRGKTQAVAEG
jgi:ATP-binding cassette subfamily C protein